MEDTLGDYMRTITVEEFKAVLILVLMEDTLGVYTYNVVKRLSTCLNPCFNGRYSRRIESTGKINSQVS